MAPKIRDDESPELLFMSELEDALAKEHLKLSGEARVYLTRLLASTRIDDAPNVQSRLSDSFLAALNTVEPRKRSLLLQSVGNSALMLCGWWWQFIEYMQEYRHLDVDHTFHEDIGTQAFRRLEEMWFQELADKFVGVVDVLARMSGKLQVHNNRELMQAYEHWLKTQNKNAEKVLLAHGLLVPRGPEQKH